MLAATIFLIVFVLLGGVVMYLSKTIDHGEARFDTTQRREMREDHDDEDDEE